MSDPIESLWKEREVLAASLGITKCDHCARFCPSCPRLLAVRPDLKPKPMLTQTEAAPSFLHKAANFGRAITQHLAAGLPQADEVTVAHRLSICYNCEKFDAERTACRVCGCHLDVKIRWQEQKCPISKW